MLYSTSITSYGHFFSITEGFTNAGMNLNTDGCISKSVGDF